MKKFLIPVLATVAALSFATAAEAKTPANVRTYGDVEFESSGVRVTFGQVFSGKAECYSKRRFGFAVATGPGKKRVLDAGRTSVDGAISGGYESGFVKGRTLFFILPKTKHCAAETVKAKPPVEMAKPVKTNIVALGLNGSGQDGAIAGLIGLNKQADCFKNRRAKLLLDGKLVDRGTTTFGGAWALHLTSGEIDSADKLAVKVAKSKRPNGTVCAGDTFTIDLTPMP